LPTPPATPEPLARNGFFGFGGICSGLLSLSPSSLSQSLKEGLLSLVADDLCYGAKLPAEALDFMLAGAGIFGISRLELLLFSNGYSFSFSAALKLST